MCVVALARISLTLPKGTSSSELLSPDYPESFPDDDTVEWYFQVPDKHGVDVQFLNLTQPDCVKKEVAVEYHQKGRVTSVLGLNDTQPLQNQGDFLLTLRNCEMERAPADSPGLTFTLKVSSYPPRSKGLYVISTHSFIVCTFINNKYMRCYSELLPGKIFAFGNLKLL